MKIKQPVLGASIFEDKEDGHFHVYIGSEADDIHVSEAENSVDAITLAEFALKKMTDDLRSLKEIH